MGSSVRVGEAGEIARPTERAGKGGCRAGHVPEAPSRSTGKAPSGERPRWQEAYDLKGARRRIGELRAFFGRCADRRVDMLAWGGGAIEWARRMP